MTDQINVRLPRERKRDFQMFCVDHEVSMQNMLIAFIDKTLSPENLLDKGEMRTIENCIARAKSLRAETLSPVQL